jgi:hypothetical protein
MLTVAPSCIEMAAARVVWRGGVVGAHHCRRLCLMAVVCAADAP